MKKDKITNTTIISRIKGEKVNGYMEGVRIARNTSAQQARDRWLFLRENQLSGFVTLRRLIQ